MQGERKVHRDLPHKLELAGAGADRGVCLFAGRLFQMVAEPEARLREQLVLVVRLAAQKNGSMIGWREWRS